MSHFNAATRVSPLLYNSVRYCHRVFNFDNLSQPVGFLSSATSVDNIRRNFLSGSTSH